MRWTASDFERLDPRLFRAFLAVVRTESFSAAAVEASLTQGAVSQQIAKLEERLNTQLFVRANGRVLTTTAGRMLALHAQAYMDHTARFLEQLNEEFESMRGGVSYAMPESCIHAPHFGWLLERRKAHPDLVLSIELKPAPEVLADVLAGAVDFGFMNQPADSQAVQAYPFCCEDYVLVGPGNGQAPALPEHLDGLLSLPLIVYPGMLHGLNRWIRAQFGETDPISTVSLRTCGQFNDLRGVLAMVEGELGCTVLPRHVVGEALAQGRLRALTGPLGQAQQAAMQQIWIVRLRERRMPARVRRVIRWFLDMHTELQPIPQEFLE
ncbi:LysR family transcriptional regulator [Ideonella livida]|uniref:LysR family transcriptional regulator n=1 Tax=Ideonella livida TaxID=2707176 RepID=A0A7C9TIR8_9BURK|nr:LysR family transcriptional regulator [Ideonella livida]NDY90443.1 LysR family transcriptional regulator [Ideonella livida]